MFLCKISHFTEFIRIFALQKRSNSATKFAAEELLL